MIISTEEKDIITASSSDFQELQFGIKQQDISHIITLLREKMYRHPIQSICREVASNSRDANREVGREDVPIVIRLQNNPIMDDQVCISFEDCGPGISPARMQEIFMNYGASSKRDSNDQTGGFGLGAKSPFAYTKSFLINTNHGGVNYVYMAAVEDNNKGRMYLLEKDEDSVAPDGTRIVIPIERGDIYTFEKHSVASTCLWDVKPIYEGFEHYPGGCPTEVEEIQPGIIQAKVVDSLRNPLPHERLNVLIDGIPYPLESFSEEIRAVSKSFQISLDTDTYVFLKYGVGDLSITPNRESLHYDESTKDLLYGRLRDYKKRLNREFSKYKKNMKFPFSILAFNSRETVPESYAKLILKKEKEAGYLKAFKRDICIKEAMEGSQNAHICEKYEEVVKTFDLKKVTRHYEGLTSGGNKKIVCDKRYSGIDYYMICSLEDVGCPNKKSLVVLMDRKSSLRSKNVYLIENYDFSYEVTPSKGFSIEDAENSLKILKLPYVRYSDLSKVKKEKNKRNIRSFPCRFRRPEYNCDSKSRCPVVSGTLTMDEDKPKVIRLQRNDYFSEEIIYNIKDVVFKGVPYLSESEYTYERVAKLMGSLEKLKEGKSYTFLVIVNNKKLQMLKEKFKIREYKEPKVSKRDLKKVSVCKAYKGVLEEHEHIFKFVEKYRGSPFVERYGRLVQEVKRLKKSISDKDYELYLSLPIDVKLKRGFDSILHNWLVRYREELFKTYPLLQVVEDYYFQKKLKDKHMSEYLDLINTKESSDG